jgi:hypothetical protein
MNKKQTYANSGVDYSAMDPIKVLAQNSARSTSANLAKFRPVEVNQLTYGKRRMHTGR